MAYNDLLNEEGIRSEYLIIMKPSRKLTGFVLHAGFVYKTSFALGKVTEVKQSGLLLSANNSVSLAQGEYYYDSENSYLYVRMSDDSNPSTKFITCIYEIYAATSAEHFNRIPTDSSSEVVFFNAFVSNAPIIKNSQSDGLIGFLPIQTTEIGLINAEHDFEAHLYYSSFNKKEIEVYHWLDELKTENVKKIMSGTMGEVRYNQRSVSIQVKDRLDLLDDEFRNVNASFWSKTSFPNIDENFIGRPIREVYGRVSGFVPVNLSYVNESPTTSDNRTWGVRTNKTKLNDKTALVLVAPVSTTTRIYLNSVVGFFIGDSIRVIKASSESTFVTAIGANYIDIFPALSLGVPTLGDSVFRPTIARVSIIQNNIKYDAKYLDDYTQNTSLTDDVLGFDFTASVEANLSIPSPISPNDRIFVSVYGKQNDITLGGPFGSNDSDIGNLTNSAPILVDLLKRAGISEAQIDSVSFGLLNSGVTDALSFAVPRTSSNDFPTYKTIISEIIQTILLRLILDIDSKFAVNVLTPVSTEDKTIDDLEILSDSISYTFNYDDILSLVRVEYDFKEQNDNTGSAENTSKVVTASSQVAELLHGVNKQKTFESLHLKESEAQVLADRLSFIFGDRQGMMTLSAKNRFFNALIGDVVLVSRDKLPGFSYSQGTERTRKLSILSTNKSLRQITLELDDQKGVEDADDEGNW